MSVSPGVKFPHRLFWAWRARLTRGCSSQCDAMQELTGGSCPSCRGVTRRSIPLLLHSPAVCTNELHTDCSSSESTSSSHKKLQMSKGISVMKINLLSFDFLFIFLNRLLHCICCNNTVSNGPSYLISRQKYITLCGNVLQRQIFFGERKGKSDG